MWGVELAVMEAMIALNGLFASYEIALASISLARLESLAGENRKGARSALAMKKNMERSLAVVQLGITLVGAIAAATGGAGAEERLVPLLREVGVSGILVAPLAIGLVVVPLTVVTIIFGELVPKIFALRNNEWMCLRLSPFMAWMATAVRPAVWFLEGSVRLIMRWGERRWQPASGGRSEAAELQELRAIAALARASHLIGAREEGIIVSAARLSSRPVREGMVRAEHISMLDARSSLAEALVAGHLDLHTRFPVAERAGDPQSVIGYANFKDIVACMRLAGHNPSLQSVIRPIPSVRDAQPLSACLEQLIREHVHIALVRDGRDRVVGMITLEDIIEEMVGEIQDEYDRLPLHIKPSGADWVIGGGAPLARIEQVTGIRLSTENGESAFKTLDEWMESQLGRPGRGGDVVRRNEVCVAVRSVRRQHINEAQVSRICRLEPETKPQ